MSMNQSPLNNWLSELSAGQGTQFKLDEQGRCFISANNNCNICIHGPAGSDSFYVNIELMTLTEENNEFLFRQALSLNLFQHETRNCALALDEKSSALMLCYAGQYKHTSFQDFTNVLNNMVDLSATLCEQLQQSQYTETAPKAGELPAFGMLC
ncbi:type III secretion system chaperone [Thalassomonas viridans]|uniref:Type III secretion system chaperone n=1 Tax=Thalassomonas viridans TaxID=137584 RepID=A0AAE9Z6I8_9GAMM|nr:CesT family type III secretion system chaperone [Thalassomonas viridans]WDE07177.1 type III secretion system chaperone [Thalassomonas viridans]